MTWVVQLDPPAIAPDRTMLDLNSGPIQIGGPAGNGSGIDWGDAEVTAYETQQGQYGNSVADIIYPNRTITIQMILGGTGYEEDEETARAELQQKVARLQAEGGQILRQRAGGPAMYADIQKAQLTIPDIYGETGDVEPDVQLVLETLPDFYGDEITLDSITASHGLADAVLKLSGSQAVIKGDYPARCRIVVTEQGSADQHGILWGFRSRHYDSAATAELVYDAATRTVLNGAATAASGSSASGTYVGHTSMPPGAWVSILLTSASGVPLTHKGSYRVYARAGTISGNPTQFRFEWGVGSLSTPITNDPAAPPAAGAWHMLDLGEVRLDPPPAGTYAWYGVVQVFVNDSGDVPAIDQLYFVPVDESAGKVSADETPPSSSIITSPYGRPSAAANDAGVGSAAWSNFSGLTSENPFTGAVVSLDSVTNPISNWLFSTGFGFAIPTSATITGIAVYIKRFQNDLPQAAIDYGIQLLKAGSVVGSNYANAFGNLWWPQGFVYSNPYGGSTDLWGTTWTPAQVNASNFGVAIAAQIAGASVFCSPDVGAVHVYVFYTLASGFTIANDAVVYQSRTAELRTEGMYRSDPAGGPYGVIYGNEGDLPRVPPSGLENRAVELFVRSSRGFITADVTDTGDEILDAPHVQVIYRPCWLSRP